MSTDQLLSIISNGGVAVVCFFLLQRVMARLDTVTDKLIAILERQQQIQAQLTQAAYVAEMDKRKSNN